LRNAVSKKKRRYQKNGFDLDLSYITDRLIAMGFPSESVEGVYRNPFKEVFRFLETYHKDHYRVYNLCSERGYDVAKFHNRVGCFPFDDHNAPPLELIFAFCKDVKEWLDSHEKNVAVIHCKAGKGRTGLMICSYMLYSGEWKTADEALNFYAAMRTYNQKGVTIPSQLRYVNYTATMVQNGYKIPEQKYLILKTIGFQTIPKVANSHDIRFSVYMYKTLVYVYKDSPKVKAEKDANSDHDVLFECTGATPIRGDIKIDFYEKGDRLFAFWFNTALIGPNNTLELTKPELDKANKDKSHKAFKENFKVILTFQPITNLPTSPSQQFGVNLNAQKDSIDPIIEEQSITIENELSSGILNHRGKCKLPSKKNAVEISQNLLKLILQIYVVNDLGNVSFNETAGIKRLQEVLNSSSFKHFALQTVELQKVSVGDLSHEERLVFWLNIYHTLRLHSNVLVTKFPSNLVELLTYEKKVKYEIAENIVSLADIEFGVLRSKTELPPVITQLNLVSKFDNSDPRQSWGLSQPEPRINFALNHGDASSPLVAVYYTSSLFDQLEKVTRTYIKDGITVNAQEKKITISGLLSLYHTDLGKNELKAVKHLKEYLPSEQKEAFSPSFSIVSSPRDFSVRYSLKHFSVTTIPNSSSM